MRDGLVGGDALVAFTVCGVGQRSVWRVELGGFGGASESGGGGFAAGNGLLDRVEVAGADEALVLDGFVAVRFFGGEFGFLELAVGAHAGLFVLAREIEHSEVEG